jgi:cephalosporin hydroxylase
MTPLSHKKLEIDLEQGTVRVEGGDGSACYDIGSPEGFAAISQAWLRSGWDNKYVYSFTWLGRPIIQLPEDVLRIQELVYSIKPDFIIETGVAHGGSLVLYASLCKVMGVGRVLGIDKEIRSHNRAAIERHTLSELITLVEGDSVDPRTIAQVADQARQARNVLVVLDSCHTKEHVLAELNAYAPLVTPGSYVIVMDGIMGQLVGAPRTQEDWAWDNPREAAAEFVKQNPDFQMEEPQFPFNEGNIKDRVTYSPSGFIRRIGR